MATVSLPGKAQQITGHTPLPPLHDFIQRKVLALAQPAHGGAVRVFREGCHASVGLTYCTGIQKTRKSIVILPAPREFPV